MCVRKGGKFHPHHLFFGGGGMGWKEEGWLKGTTQRGWGKEGEVTWEAEQKIISEGTASQSFFFLLPSSAPPLS